MVWIGMFGDVIDSLLVILFVWAVVLLGVSIVRRVSWAAFRYTAPRSLLVVLFAWGLTVLILNIVWLFA